MRDSLSTNLPTGTVTFLFTDIEGSTKLWQRDRAAMAESLSLHHAILSETIAAHKGYVFQIIGDAFCAAFSTAGAGLEAALEAQRALRDATWRKTSAIRVRMALHAGMADLRVGEYTSGEYISGLTLSRAARLLSAGHGGQILLSLPTAELVVDSLPAETVLLDLGLHQLKDLIRPEHIFQAVVPDLGSEFPPLKTLDTQPNNLPTQLTSFVGRKQEMERIKELVRSARIITLTGVGGSGKTRLALQVAADIIDEFPDGAWTVDFAPLVDPSLIPHRVIGALGLQLQSGRTSELALLEYLRDRHCLLLFDNCEHLVDACARLTDSLVRGCPNLKILSTSRESLSIAGEVIYSVPSLAIPSLEVLSVQALSQYESVRLFFDRATSLQPNFSITEQNAPSISQICNQLDGIPLAIELAAAKVNVLSVEQISERLVDRFRLLTGGSRTALPRQQTLRALIDWSYSLLSAIEQTVFERLSVFAGGWTLEAAESICAGDGIESYEILESLASLAAKSLVTVSEGVDGRSRYSFLETIRQYADEKLAQSKQISIFRDRHLDWYLDFAGETLPKLFGAEQISTLDRLDVEHSNFIAALSWSMETTIDKGLCLAANLYRFWRLRGYWFDRLDWLNRLLAHPDGLTPSSTRALALVTHGDLQLSQGDYPDAEQSYAESLHIFRTIGDEKGTALSLCELARLFIQVGNIARAHELSRESLEISRKMGDGFQITQALNRLAQVLSAQGEHRQANQLLNESLSLFTPMVDLGSVQEFYPSPDTQNAFYILATSEQELGEFEQAQIYFEQGLRFFRQTGSSHEIAWFLRHLAHLAWRGGDLSSAHTLYQESLQIVQDMKDKYCIAHALNGLARVEIGNASYERAVSLAHQALSLYEQVRSKQRIAQVQCTLGLALLTTNLSQAKEILKSSLRLRYKLGSKVDVAESLEAIATMSAEGGDFERAARLHAATRVLRESASSVMTHPVEPGTGSEPGRLCAELGEERFTNAWNDGRALSLEQAVELALNH